jgi:phenylacetate-CoA ligase
VTARTWWYREVVYRATDLLFRRDTFAAFDEIGRLRALPCEQLARYRVDQLRGLLAHAQRSVPFYRDRYGEAGFRPEALVSLEDLAAVPVLTKADIREHGSRMIAEGWPSPLTSFCTSGSTGRPVVVKEDQTENAWRRAVKWRYLDWWDVGIGERGALVWLLPIQGVGRRVKKRLAFKLNNCDTLLNVCGLSAQKMRAFWTALERQRVGYLYGYTSAITEFARFALVNGLPDAMPLRLKVVIPTTEMLFPEQRELMERAFGCRVANEYGSSELGDIAFECPAGSMHVASESFVVEVVPPFFPTDTGVAGQAVVTHLRKRAMPLIRYALGDVIHLVDAPCPCGRRTPIVRSVEGRLSDVIVTPSGMRIHSHVFGYILDQFGALENPAVTAFRAIQREPARFEVLVVPGPAYDERKPEAIAAQVKLAFGAECAVEVRAVERIPPDPSGKFRFFLSEVPKRP